MLMLTALAASSFLSIIWSAIFKNGKGMSLIHLLKVHHLLNQMTFLELASLEGEKPTGGAEIDGSFEIPSSFGSTLK